MQQRFWAPGRVNLIGEHTDYSGGLVLPIAIQLGIGVTVAPATRIALVSDGEVAEIAPDGCGEVSGWGRYVAAVAQELADLGRPAVGIEGHVDSDLPRGAGLGSSGALVVVLALALCAVADFELEPLELVRACQRAEQRAVGVATGILDEAASLLGRADHALFLECGTFEHRWVRLPEDVAFVVVDSGERHAHESSGYAERRRELEAGHPRRLRPLASENERVRAAVSALRRGDVGALGELFAASHASLRDDYEVSTPALDALVEDALAAGAFAARLTGGGFGGSVVALVERNRAAEVLRRIGAPGWVVRASEGATRRRTDCPPDPA